MSREISAKTGGILLIAASLLGVVLMSVYSATPPSESRERSASPAEQRANVAGTSTPPGASPTISATAARDSATMFVVPSTEPVIEHIESPFSSEGTDSVAALCAAQVRLENRSHGADTSGVEIGERYGVHPIPGRGRDSLIVEGTSPGRDETRAVWHCAATTTVAERRGVMRVVIEDGWPGVPSRFQSAHPITVAAHELCDKRTEAVLPETDLRNAKRWRVADTLHVTGETMPLNSGELSHDFHCRATVLRGAIVRVVSGEERG